MLLVLCLTTFLRPVSFLALLFTQSEVRRKSLGIDSPRFLHGREGNGQKQSPRISLKALPCLPESTAHDPASDAIDSKESSVATTEIRASVPVSMTCSGIKVDHLQPPTRTCLPSGILAMHECYHARTDLHRLTMYAPDCY